jgi:hypothetical protein
MEPYLRALNRMVEPKAASGTSILFGHRRPRHRPLPFYRSIHWSGRWGGRSNRAGQSLGASCTTTSPECTSRKIGSPPEKPVEGEGQVYGKPAGQFGEPARSVNEGLAKSRSPRPGPPLSMKYWAYDKPAFAPDSMIPPIAAWFPSTRRQVMLRFDPPYLRGAVGRMADGLGAVALRMAVDGEVARPSEAECAVREAAGPELTATVDAVLLLELRARRRRRVRDARADECEQRRAVRSDLLAYSDPLSD